MTEEKLKYYTCRYDRPFKEIFLKEKNKHMLKALLELILKIKIHDIQLRPNERNTGNLSVSRKTYDALLSTNIGKIEIEVNANNKKHIHPRNMAYICDLYSHHTLISDNYNEDTMIIQINLSYELGKNKQKIQKYEIKSNEGNLFVKNLQIIEINMDYFVNLWYDNDKKKIDENKLLIMLGLDKENLEKMSNNYVEVKEYMSELDRINEDPEFREYMSEEEDKRKIFNSEIREAREYGLEQGKKEGLEQGKKEGLEQGKQEGMQQGMQQGIEHGINKRNIEIAKNLLKINLKIEDISKTTGLSIDEIKNLK